MSQYTARPTSKPWLVENVKTPLRCTSTAPLVAAGPVATPSTPKMRDVSFGSATPTVFALIGTTTCPAAIGSPATKDSMSVTCAFCNAFTSICNVVRR